MKFINRTSISHNINILHNDLTSGLEGPFDLGILFVSQSSQTNISETIKHIKGKLNVKNIFACSAAGIIGSEEEIEFKAGASLTLAKLPGISLKPFYFDQSTLESLKTKKDFYDFLQVTPTENPTFFAFPDPFEFDITRFIYCINECYPKCPVLGGIASASAEPNGNTLIHNEHTYHNGTIGFILTGDIKVDTIVSQGCRPIGENYIVTKSDRNVIYELAGKPFLRIVEEIFQKASDEDKRLAQEAVLVGVAMDEYKFPYKRGDFLIRSLMSIDQETGAGIVGDQIKQGQTVQLHLRDAKTATEDLTELLKTYAHDHPQNKPEGALIFCCNGRGENLFKIKNHDINILQKHIGPLTAGGFFCAGEIGPVGGFNFIHGFTDSIALFYSSSPNTS